MGIWNKFKEAGFHPTLTFPCATWFSPKSNLDVFKNPSKTMVYILLLSQHNIITTTMLVFERHAASHETCPFYQQAIQRYPISASRNARLQYVVYRSAMPVTSPSGNKRGVSRSVGIQLSTTIFGLHVTLPFQLSSARDSNPSKKESHLSGENSVRCYVSFSEGPLKTSGRYSKYSRRSHRQMKIGGVESHQLKVA